MAATPILLDYGRPRNRWRRLLWSLPILLAVAVAIYLAPDAWDQGRLWYLQRCFAAYAPPPNRVICENGTFVTPRPSAVDDYISAAGFSSLITRGKIVVFAGELKTPAGKRRLVAVEFFSQYYEAASAAVIEPGSVLGAKPKLLNSHTSFLSWFEFQSWNWGFSTLFKPEKARIYAGQADPADRSHFTIRYQGWGNENVIDGHIDDENNITLEPRRWTDKWSTAPTTSAATAPSSLNHLESSP